MYSLVISKLYNTVCIQVAFFKLDSKDEPKLKMINCYTSNSINEEKYLESLPEKKYIIGPIEPNLQQSKSLFIYG